MDGGEVCSAGGPLDEGFGPARAVNIGVWVVLFAVPEDADVLVAVHCELVARVGVREPGAEVLAFGEGLDGGGGVFVFDAAFAAVVFDVGELVDADGVFAVEGDAVEGFAGGEGLFRGVVFDEGVAGDVSSGI